MNGPRWGDGPSVRESGALVPGVDGDAFAAAGLRPVRLAGLAAALQFECVLQPGVEVGPVLVDVEPAAHGVVAGGAPVGAGPPPSPGPPLRAPPRGRV